MKTYNKTNKNKLNSNKEFIEKKANSLVDFQKKAISNNNKKIKQLLKKLISKE